MAIGIALAVLVYLHLQGADVLPFLLLAAGIGVISHIGRGQPLPFSRSSLVSAARSKGDAAPVSFDDIGGQEVAKRELLEALQFLKDESAAARLGIRPLRGLLLVGPPGTGKTMMARAAAGYTGSAFVSASGSEFVEMYAGVGAQRIRRLFRRARESARSQKKRSAVIFIDEIEVIGGARGRSSSHLEYDQTLNELLIQLDGIDSQRDGIRILLIAATNRPDLLDPALLRPGRFDRTVRVDLPDKAGRLHILRLHTRTRPLAGDVDLESLAEQTLGFSGAHLESVVNEAAIHTLRDGRDAITAADFHEAIEKVMMGERLDRRLRAQERRRIAYHEVGHALLGERLRPGSVQSVTIAPRGQALGYIRQSPGDEGYLQTHDELLDQICVCLAGAVAEETFLGSRSTNSAQDFDKAVELAERIVASGLSSLGVINPKTLSPSVQHRAVRSILKAQEERARRTVENERRSVEAAALRLLQEEALTGKAFREIIGAPDPGLDAAATG